MAKPLPGREYPHRQMSITNKGVFVLHGKMNVVLEKCTTAGYMWYSEYYDEFSHGCIVNTQEVRMRVRENLGWNFVEILDCPMCMLSYSGEHWEQCDSRFEWKSVQIDIYEDYKIGLSGRILIPIASADSRTFVENYSSLEGKLVKTMDVILGFMTREELNFVRFGKCPGCLLGLSEYHDDECIYTASETDDS